ncbi:MAG: hypothetical protein V1750_09350, partial [Acidobacteriota bacterium]
ARAFGAGLGASATIWLPAALVSGPGFWKATRAHGQWVGAAEDTLRFPGAQLDRLLEAWLVQPFGSAGIAVGFWALVGLGVAGWLAAGRRRLVVVAGISAGCYLLGAFVTLNLTTAVRYFLPAACFLALLAGGVAAYPRLLLRRIGIALATVWCLLALAWAWPVLALRREASPSWAALTWIRDHHEPAKTFVAHDGTLGPFVKYLLGPLGFESAPLVPGTVYDASLKPGGTVLLVFPRPIPGAEVLYSREWSSERLAVLTRSRYQSCVVARAGTGEQPVYSPDWRVLENEWELWGTGTLSLPAGTTPWVVRFTGGSRAVELQRPGRPKLPVPSHRLVEGLLIPGSAGAWCVTSPLGVHTLLPPVETVRFAPGMVADELSSAYVVPQAVHFGIEGGRQWRTDLTLINPQPIALPLVVQFLPRGRDNAATPAVEVTLSPGAMLAVEDVLSRRSLRAAGDAGALLLYVDEERQECSESRCDFIAFSRTYDASEGGVARPGEGLPGIPAERALAAGGKATFDRLPVGEGGRVIVGGTLLGEDGGDLRVVVRDSSGAEVDRIEYRLAAWACPQATVEKFVPGGAVTLELATPRPTVFFPFVTVMTGGGKGVSHFLASMSGSRAFVEPRLLPRPRRMTPPGQASRPK